MKLMERMKQKRLGNKGFSLVELIIVIAIMAVLIGIVGTQVVPYLRRAREEKDMQILNSFSTAGVTYYSLNTEKFVNADGIAQYGEITFKKTGNYGKEGDGSAALSNPSDIGDLTGYKGTDGWTALNKAMSSQKGKNIYGIGIVINPTSGNAPSAYGGNFTVAPGTVVAYAFDGSGNQLLQTVTSYIGTE